MNNDEWVYQYPIGKFVERQGWKIHISSEYNSSHELLQDVAKICHEMRIPFKHLSTEDKFIMRNGKLVSRGFSGKFITCYPNQNELESVLQKLESALKQYNGPYILSDKRWDEVPIYLRYGVFRPSRDDEKKVAIDELIVGDEVVKDERLPVFKIPKGIVPPDFLNKWLDKKDKKQGDFPFIIDNAIRFSNSGGIYNARLKEDGKKIILKEARPYTGLGFDGTYSSERLASECKALKILNEWSEMPKIYLYGKIWEHTFLGIEHMKGVPLNRWVTNNFPLYEVVDKTKDYLLRVSKIVEKLIDLTNKFHSENVYHQDLHLGNILVKDEDEISIIDWEQAVFSNDEKVVHKVAASGFRSWRETFPSEIDWYGIRQIAHYLYMPLVTTSDSASRGEFISILGISGSGKSTLLKCISSLLEPTSGEVILNGINPYKIRNAKLSSIRRNEVSFIFQAYNLIPSLPVIENIALPLRLSQKKLTIKNVENLLKRMKFNAGLNDFVGTLSGGEQQKVAIARAVIADSDIIFADEPTGALDSVSREVIFELLRELVGAGKCVIMVTHDIELASKTDRALILKDGKIFKELHRPSGEELYKILEVQSTTEE